VLTQSRIRTQERLRCISNKNLFFSANSSQLLRHQQRISKLQYVHSKNCEIIETGGTVPIPLYGSWYNYTPNCTSISTYIVSLLWGGKPSKYRDAEAVLAIRPGRPWPTQTRAWPTQTARVIPMIPTYATPVGLPEICLASDWPTQMKIPRTAPVAMVTDFGTLRGTTYPRCVADQGHIWHEERSA